MPDLTMGGKRKRHRNVLATMPELSLYFKWLRTMTLGVFENSGTAPSTFVSLS